ncbi:MAG: GGDEF domain-containing protein, partial [Solirubrobacteraceae bacterium]|nr:GGDEF domain-containing protein [Solirubrobacteraceae bacterium]
MSRISSTAVHLSRKDLALDRRVWHATAGMTLFMAIAIGGLSVLDTDALHFPIAVIAATFTCIALALFSSEPPEIGSRLNHAVVALPWFGASSMFYVSNIGAGVAVGAAMFIGPLASVRLQDQRQFVAHLAAASVSFFAVAVLVNDPATSICLLVTAMAMWVLGFTCWAVLSMAEAQGEELDRLVRRDPLTGIGNLRLLRDRLEHAIERHGRIKQPFSIILLDLNGFKAINDELSHADGDAILRGVATALERAIESDQTVVRQGGDEFCVL